MAILAVQVTSLTSHWAAWLSMNPHTTPIAAPVLVYLNHDSKANKDNAASDNRTSTYATPVLMDPQLRLGLHVYSRLAG
jgi:hypothetical protein